MVFDGQVFEFIKGFIVDSIRNTIAAFMWPVHIVRFAQPWGAIALGLAFWLFPIYVKPHIERWLFDDDAVDATPIDEDSKE